MHQQPLLSIIIPFHNQREWVEPTLSALYEMKAIPFELFILDDASSDGSRDTIQSLLEHYQHEHTYFFEYTGPIGRGNCLNEALRQCNGSVLWIPPSVERIYEELLYEAASHLYKSSFTFYCAADSLPSSSPDQWIDFIETAGWPDDGDFLWNLNLIPHRQRFFNPYLTTCHALELAARLIPSSRAGQIESWHTSAQEEAPQEITPQIRSEIAYTLLRGRNITEEQRNRILSFLSKNEGAALEPTPASGSLKLLDEAEQMKQDGRDHAALELVEHVLAEQPDNRQAIQLKIEILERQHRFVEASEVKHAMKTSERPSAPASPRAEETKVKTSVIIPTALYGKPALENCLLSLAEHCNPQTTELIIIDNASLDDTHDYLAELQSKDFFRCKVITNRQNAGFAASVNQGLERASGAYACIMHNDVELTNDALHQLEQLMDAHPEFAVAGPLTNKTLNPAQTPGSGTGDEGLISVDYLDSFCMMLRLDTGLRMDEDYQLAFFEDIDLCFQARRAGYKAGIAAGVEVEHHFGTTTFPLNLDTESEEYWKNVARFNEKWNVEAFAEEELKSKSGFDQLLELDAIVNPLYPEDSIVHWFEQLFTDEVKTEILKSNHDPDTLCRLVHLMMVMDQREVMRRLEDRLDEIELPASLINQLVRFYFNKNIYSRCNHYLDRLKEEERSLQSELYRLSILINEKELEAAVPKLRTLLEEAPAHPLLYKLTGDIYRFEGNKEEAASFYRIAHQINPFEYSPDGIEELKLKSQS